MEGIKTIPGTTERKGNTRWNASLIWKGLRQRVRDLNTHDPLLECFPDLEGIKTYAVHVVNIKYVLECFPDLEGIKTREFRKVVLYRLLECFPDLEGIKTPLRDLICPLTLVGMLP